MDFRNDLKISSLCGYFQEIAGVHAGHLGFGIDDIRQEGLVWVLSRLEIVFTGFPKWGESIILETWPSGNERLFYRREFIVSRPTGKKIINAASFWLLINAQTRRPKLQPLPPGIEKANQGKYALMVMKEPISPVFEGESEMIPVRYGDLDLNWHVNNLRYIQWITDQFPVEYHNTHEVVFLRTDFRREVRAHDSLSLTKMAVGDNTYVLEGKVNDSGLICFHSMIKFKSL